MTESETLVTLNLETGNCVASLNLVAPGAFLRLEGWRLTADEALAVINALEAHRMAQAKPKPTTKPQPQAAKKPEPRPMTARETHPRRLTTVRATYHVTRRTVATR